MHINMCRVDIDSGNLDWYLFSIICVTACSQCPFQRNPNLHVLLCFQFIIYLSRVLCLSVCVCVCVSQVVAERSAILLVLIIKLTKETRRRVWRGRDMDGEIREGET